MESKTSTPNQQITNECNHKDSVMTISYTILNASCGQIHEQKICECVDYFGGIWCRIVVLEVVSTRNSTLEGLVYVQSHTNQSWMYEAAKIPRTAPGMVSTAAMTAQT